ncbi:hypothetical protein WJX81_000780 [Elliptochloris bilobata]|uniref:Major facilitator superfamily (MFS) profile domain-containing protein n=1 Tax=Elliptochloris bilobata TaxID=381761 RepID=A0AAW1S0W3_9CHLO
MDLPPPQSGLFLEVSFLRLLRSCEDIIAGDAKGRADLEEWATSPVFHHYVETLQEQLGDLQNQTGGKRVDSGVLALYQERLAELVPRLQPPHIPAFCAALPAHCRGVVGGLRQRPARAVAAAEPAAALDDAGMEAIQRQQNLQDTLTDEMVGLAAGLKRNAAAMEGAVKERGRLLDSAETMLDGNLDATKRSVRESKVIRTRGARSLCMRLLVLFLVGVAFAGVYIFIKATSMAGGARGATPGGAVDPFAPPPAPPREVPDLGTIWGLVVLGIAYVHHSTTGYAVPALLPMISADLQLADSQGAALTVGYTVLYALALVPVGFLADRADRPRLLAGGLMAWSLLTMAASKVHSFGELLALRVGFAAAQATQNPICFSLIPELFPRGRNTAMAAYNAAIYCGRALSFAAVIIAGQLGVTHAASESVGVTMVPLEAVDLSHVSILYTQGEMAAITPIYDYDFHVLYGALAESSWRTLLFWLGPPGLVVAGLCLLTLDEPRKPAGGFLGDPFASSKFTNSATRAFNRSGTDRFTQDMRSSAARAAKAARAAEEAEAKRRDGDMWKSVRKLVGSRSFQAVTAAAALNDVGSWALISFQATFYMRVYDLTPDVYAPALATILPIGGIVGGVGGGLLADWLSRIGGRGWLTAGATISATPALVFNVLAPEYQQSLAALLVGFALSEMWRAPAAIMIRDVSPPNLGSTGSAVHLCVRNLIGGLGPLGIAWLEDKVGLQQAMLLVPACYLLSGIGFLFAERVITAETAAKAAAEAS